MRKPSAATPPGGWLPLILSTPTRIATGAMLVGLAGVLFTLYGTHQINRRVNANLDQHLQHGAMLTDLGLHRMAARQEQLLLGLRVHLQSTAQRLDGRHLLDPQAMDHYLEQTAPSLDDEGVRVVALVHRVPVEGLPAFLNWQHAHGHPGYAMRAAGSGVNPDLWLVQHNHPAQGNEAALGLEVASDPARYQVMQMALQSGAAQLTPPVKVVQDNARRLGVVLYLPVPHGDGAAATAVDNFLVSVVVLDDAFAHWLHTVTDGGAHVDLMYGKGAARRLIYTSDPGLGHMIEQAVPNVPTSLEREVTLNGQTFSYRVRLSEAVLAANETLPSWVTILAGLLLSGLLADLFRRSQMARLTAERHAGHLSQDNALLARVSRETLSPMMVTDPQGLIVWVNPAFEALSGYALKDCQGQRPGALLQCENTDPEAVAMMRRAVRERAETHIEVLNRARDGREYWVALDITPMRNEHGELTGFMSVGTDITQRRQAQAAVTAALNELQTERDIFASGPVATVEMGKAPGLPIRRLSANGAEVLGHPRADLLRGDFLFQELVHPEDLPKASTLLRNHARSGKSFVETTLRLRNAQGTYRWFFDHTQIVRDKQGRTQSLRGYLFDISSQHAVEQALSQERERLQRLMEAADVGTWEWNVVTGECRFNERWASLGGRTLEDLRPFTVGVWARLCHPQDLDRSREQFQRHLRGETTFYEIEARIRHQDGRWVWVLGRGLVMARLTNGEPHWVYGILQDIDARKQSELALQRARTELELANALARIGAWEVETDTQRMVWSDMTRRIHEVEPGFEPSVAAALAFLPEGAPREGLRNALEAACAHNRPFDLELPLRSAKGQALWVRVLGYPVLQDGRCVRVAGSYHDITEVHLLHQRVTEARDILQGLVDHLPMGLMVFDEDRRLVLANQSLRETVGVEPTELRVGEQTFESAVRRVMQNMRMDPGEQHEVLGGIERWQRHPNPWRVERARDDGRIIEVQRLPMPHGGFFSSYTDITPFVQATQSAREASRSKSEFLAHMSHEIRTPMNAILGLMTLLTRTPLNPTQQGYARNIEVTARNLLALLNDILDLSKVEAGKLQLDPEPFSLEDLMQEVGNLLITNVGDKPVDLLLELDPTLPPLLVGDALRLRQVLVNLGGNAVKFTDQGEVHMKVRLKRLAGERALLGFVISDTGVGIPPERQAAVFEAFAQADTGTTRRFGGTGLGLTICQRLLAMMGSAIDLHSLPGVGSTFAFDLSLPLAVGQAPLAAPLPAFFTDMPVLLVEDNHVSRHVLQDMAMQLGWRVTPCDSDSQAMAHLQHALDDGQPYRLLLLDWQLPEQGAASLLRRAQDLCQRRQTERPTVLILSTPALAPSEAEARDLGLHGVTHKPLTASLLRRAALKLLAPADPAAEVLAQDDVGTLVLPSSGPRLQGLRVLVVEDNDINQQVANELLSQEGAEVQLAGNGQLGVDALRRQPERFDAVLMDMQMPVMNGLDAAQAIRRDLGLHKLPIVAMTANAMESDRRACLEAGMDEHIGKPFEIDQLVEVLCRLTGHRPAVVVASSPTPMTAPPLPALPEESLDDWEREGLIESRPALKRLGNQLPFYLKILHSYLIEAPRQMQDAAQHWAQGQWERSAGALHALKGTSATVGATALWHRVADMEREAKARVADPPPPEAASDWPASLEALAERSFEALATLARQLAPAPVPTAPGPASPSARAAAAQELVNLLRNADMAAVDSAERLLALSWPAPDELLNLSHAMDTLDFDAALNAAQSLLSGVDSQRAQGAAEPTHEALDQAPRSPGHAEDSQ